MRILNPPVSPIGGIALRQIEPAGCAAWFDYLRLPQVFERTSWNLRSVDDLQPALESCLREGPTSPIRLAVVDPATGRLVGTIGLHTVSDVNRSAEICRRTRPAALRSSRRSLRGGPGCRLKCFQR